jgi:predicted amidophosphoribosyltransferase
MTLASLAWLWFALAVGCVLAGMALTGRRLDAIPPTQRVSKERVRASKHGRSLCPRCAQPLDRDACFCGACGLHLGRKQRQRVSPSRKPKGERI